MTEAITINTSRLNEVLDQLRQSEGAGLVFTTTIIDKYMGGFHSNLNVPVGDSWNAQFGKYLKANEQALRIRQIEANVPVTVNGHPTSSSNWQLLN